MIVDLMTGLLLTTGFTGALTLVFVLRRLHHWLVPPLVFTSHFSPKGGCTEVVVRELHAARREILVLAYSFSSKPIADALVEAKKRGVHVDVVLDHSNEQEEYSLLKYLVEKGLAPAVDSHHAIAHNKVMVIDRHTVITGSFNFTHQAEAENAENLLVIKHHAELVHTYRENFGVHKAHAHAPGAKPATAPEHHKRAA